MRKKILSLTKSDFLVDTFRSGGKGGQHQNKTDSGVRIRHLESGSAAESRESRSQHRNKKAAFRRLIKSTKFNLWLHRKINGIDNIEQELSRLLDDQNIKTEIVINGKWTEIKPNELRGQEESE